VLIPSPKGRRIRWIEYRMILIGKCRQNHGICSEQASSEQAFVTATARGGRCDAMRENDRKAEVSAQARQAWMSKPSLFSTMSQKCLTPPDAVFDRVRSDQTRDSEWLQGLGSATRSPKRATSEPSLVVGRPRREAKGTAVREERVGAFSQSKRVISEATARH
jgi:hypothetical protein